jgi:hypothetical protein
MRGKRVAFFAAEQDLRQLLTAFEATNRCHYYLEGSFDHRVVTTYQSLLDVPQLGRVQQGDWNHACRLLVVPLELPLLVRLVPQRRGGMRSIIDAAENPCSFTLTLGGTFHQGVLVASGAVTSATDATTLALFGSFAKLVKKQPRIGAFYVWQQAQQYLQAGWRLVTNVSSPPQYDLAVQ